MKFQNTTPGFDDWIYDGEKWIAERVLDDGVKYQAVMVYDAGISAFVWSLFLDAGRIALGEAFSAGDGRDRCLVALTVAMRLRQATRKTAP